MKNLKVGDRVSVTGPQSSMIFNNTIGTVKIEDYCGYVGIEFDNPFYSGHEFSKIVSCKKNCGYFVRPKIIIKIEEKDEYKFLSETKVITPEGEIFQVGDKVNMENSNNPVFTNNPYPEILGFRWSKDKSKICAILDERQPNGIGVEQIQLYVEPKFVLPEKWMFLYNNKEEFDAILKKFPKLNWFYSDSQNKNGYYSNPEGVNSWISRYGPTKDFLLSQGYVQLTFEEFQKYVPNE